MAIDFIVVLIAAAAFRSVESALYAAITIFINGKVVDALIAGFNYAKAAYIVTERAQEVSKGILAEIGRGVTALEATGMYTESPKKVLFCVVKKQELVHLKEVIRRTDPEAFVILTQATEVLGEGFLSRGRCDKNGFRPRLRERSRARGRMRFCPGKKRRKPSAQTLRPAVGKARAFFLFTAETIFKEGGLLPLPRTLLNSIQLISSLPMVSASSSRG
jgi:uncharacterized protein YebE (UPF0316 family)